jgi:hypothetical protein
MQKVPPKHAIQTKKGYRGIAKLILKPLNDKLNAICHLLALLGAHHILHVSRIRVNLGAGWVWVVNTRPQQLYPQERALVPIVQDVGRVQR